MTPKTVYFVLTELNLLLLIWRSLINRPSCVIGTRSVLTGRSPRYLERIVYLLRKASYVDVLETDRPGLILHPSLGDFIRSTNVFAESESWLGYRMNFERSKEVFRDFDVSYRHVCANAAFNRFETAYLIRGIIQSDDEARIVGLDEFDVDYYGYRFQSFRFATKTSSVRTFIANSLLLSVASFWTILAIGVRVNFRLQNVKKFRIGCDFIHHPTNEFLWDEVAQTPDDALIVFRSRSDQETYKNQIDGHPYTLATDGRFSFLGGVKAGLDSIRDYVLLFKHARSLPTDFFRRMVSLPYHRIMYRGLFNRYYCDFYWCRDDYNPEHALRSLELRRHRSVSIGIMHGIPSITAIVPQLRHIDFDIYYVAGRFQAETYYKKWWPVHMKVTPIGAFGVSREEFLMFSDNNSKRNGIACFLSPHLFHDEIMDTLENIAAAFPHRTLFINTKYKPSKLAIKTSQSLFDADIERFMESAPENIKFYPGRSYDLFLECDTVLSAGSTLGAEAIQFGLNAFVFDYEPDQWKVLDYRRFPGACVNSSDHLLQRLSDIENGNWQFPRDKWSDFIDMSGIVPWDIIRADMGLPVKTKTSDPLQISD